MADLAFLTGCFVQQSAHPELKGISLLRSVLGALDSKPIGIIIALLIGLSVTTLITQSLEFAAIRALEGYWGSGWLSALPYRFSIWYQQRRFDFLSWDIDMLEKRAFRACREDVADDLFSALPKQSSAGNPSQPPLTRAAVVNAVSSVALGKSLVGFDQRLLDLNLVDYRRGTAWLDFAPARMRHRLKLLENKKNGEFPPDESRMMPTRLGNLLRGSEDRLTGDTEGRRLRGYVIRNLHRISPWLLAEHDQYRNRLDMYSILTFVAGMLAMVNGVAVFNLFNGVAAAIVTALFLLVSVMSYRGALASASDYGTILESIDEALSA